MKSLNLFAAPGITSADRPRRRSDLRTTAVVDINGIGSAVKSMPSAVLSPSVSVGPGVTVRTSTPEALSS